MREWRRSGGELPCGNCSTSIPKNAPFMVIAIGGTRRARCAPCTKRLFGEDPPAVIEDTVRVPQPSLPMEVTRRPDFVTPRQLVGAVRAHDWKARQSGEPSREPGEDDGDEGR